MYLRSESLSQLCSRTQHGVEGGEIPFRAIIHYQRHISTSCVVPSMTNPTLLPLETGLPFRRLNVNARLVIVSPIASSPWNLTHHACHEIRPILRALLRLPSTRDITP